MYMFVIRAIAERDNPHYSTVQQAKVHIWVAMEDQSQAEAAAYEYIRSYKWIPQEIEYAFAIQPELIPQLHEDEARLYHKAQQYVLQGSWLHRLAVLSFVGFASVKKIIYTTFQCRSDLLSNGNTGCSHAELIAIQGHPGNTALASKCFESKIVSEASFS